MEDGMKTWTRNRNTTTLLFSLKGLDILHQERRGKEKTIVLEHFNGILFHKSRHANKQHTNQSNIEVGNMDTSDSAPMADRVYRSKYTFIFVVSLQQWCTWVTHTCRHISLTAGL